MGEKWKEYYSEQDLIKIQQIEQESLKVFVDVCEKLGLNYVVYGGTLLGTVKYEKMIPWDDDIDVALPREDYNVFIKNAPEMIPEDYVLQTPYSDENLPYMYTKLRYKKARIIEKDLINTEVNQGIYIDIYPLDDIPDDDQVYAKQFLEIQKLMYVYYFRQVYRKLEGTGHIISNLKRRIKYNVYRVIPHRYWVNKIDKIMTRYNGKGYQKKVCFNSPNIHNVYYQLFPLKKAKFGDLEVNIPYDYETHLRMRYGNYKEELRDDLKYGHTPVLVEFDI